jgi:DnaK suppressor protein
VSEDLQLDEYRILLVNERRRLVERLTDLGIAAGERPSASAVLDSGQVAAWRGEGRSTAEQLQDSLKEVDDAIERLDQGTYGICQSCHGGIPPERLEAMPASLLCIKCASRV